MQFDGNQADNWIPATQAAETLGTTPLNILMHIKRGLLLGIEGDGVWLVESASLAALMRTRKAGKLPEVCQGGCARHAGGCSSCA